MPEVDLTSVGACDPKVSSENHAKINDYKTSPTLQEVIPTILHPDHASESFFLSKETEIDRLDRNSFLDRNASGKGCNTSISTNSNPIHISSGSHRYSGNLTSLIALPKSQKQNYAEVKNRRHCRTSSVRLFPKRSEQARGKQVVVLSEPGSPKVSCIGRVRSRKDKSRRGKNRKKDSEPDLVRVKSVKAKKYGFWKQVRSIFRFKENKLECEKSQCGEEYMMVFKRSFSSKKKREFYFKNNGDCGGSSEMSPVEPPGLGGMKRFASGRKSDAWAGDVEVDGAESEPLDRSGRANIWQRREVGPPVEIDIHRDWRKVGPASV